MIFVGSYWWAREAAADLDPWHIISIMDPGAIFTIPHGPSLVRHIKIGAHDVVMDQHRLGKLYTSPSPRHVRELVRFAACWDGKGKVLIHCMAGVSRSTAAALVILAARNPGHELEIARLMRQRSPWAAPNPRIVELADQFLKRRGTLIAALGAMGPPDMTSSPVPMFLPSDIGG